MNRTGILITTFATAFVLGISMAPPGASATASWRQAVDRVSRFVLDVPMRWDGERVVVIGHTATRWALDHVLGGIALEDLVDADFAWQEGWEYST
jgi:broad specificity phosphatase PhoE